MGTHLHLTFTLWLNDIDQVKLLLRAIADHPPDHPVFIVQLERSMQITFEHEWDITMIENAFAAHFQEYEFITDIANAREDVLLIIMRQQNPSSANSWGQSWNEDTITTYKYLVKKRERTAQASPNTTFWVLFGEELKTYEVHLAPGKVPGTGQEGFLVVGPPETQGMEPEILSDLLPDKTSAFWNGFQIMEQKIAAEYAEFRAKKLSKRRKNSPKKPGKP